MKYFTKDIKTKTKKRGSNLKQKINKREINILTLKDAIENKFNLTKALNKKKTIIKE
jgi:lambda repressor-like predicted transcriptional regulator